MLLWFRHRCIVAVGCGLLCASAVAQAPPAHAAPQVNRRKTSQAKRSHRKAPPHAVRRECVAAAGFCVDVPAGWRRLGNVFGQLGFVAAEPHPGTSDAAWPQLTVAVLPTAKGGGEDATAPSLDALVDRMLAPEGSDPAPRTLRRSQRLINGANAEIVEVQLPPAGAHLSGAIEEAALIAGDGGFVYSIALRCAPGELARLQPVFERATKSWRIEAIAPRQRPPRSQSTPEKP